MKQFAIFLSFCFITLGNAHENTKQTLEIYTYQSFISGGITKDIKRLFEKKCKTCEVKFKGFDDAQSIINRLKIEGDNSHADLILGIDNNLLAEAENLVQTSAVDLSPLKLPIVWTNQTFIPYDYGYFSFTYNKDKLNNPPTNFKNLANSNVSIIIQDPRISSPGLGLLLWIEAAYQEQSKQIWTDLKDNIVTVTKGWSEAYGLFLEGEADMVLSYTTSPLYHQLMENNNHYQALLFDEGHYIQLEVAAITKQSDSIALANQFLTFMLSDEFQKRIPKSNWMFPVTAVTDIPAPFLQAKQPKTLPLFDKKTIKDNKDNWINQWLETL